MFSVVLWATVLWATAGLPGTRIAPHGMARGPALARREAPSLSSLSRRALLGGSLACPCCFLPQSADALAALVTPPNARDASAYDVPRDSRRDSGFACGMANGMGDYEAAVAGRKRELFDRLLARLPRSDAVVVELGMGSFPNAQFLAAAPTGSASRGPPFGSAASASAASRSSLPPVACARMLHAPSAPMPSVTRIA